MKERPMLFSGPMVRAILAGRKTVTRRLVNPQPDFLQIHEWKGRLIYEGEGRTWCWKEHCFWDGDPINARPGPEMDALCPHGKPGDRLWAKETHAQFSVGEGRGSPVPLCIAYRATCDEDGGFDYVNGRGEIMRLKVTRWTPSLFMRRWMSRLTLEIVSVRVERLQGITEEDARAEGLDRNSKDNGITWKYGIADRDGWPGTDDNGWPWRDWNTSAREAFARLWDGINGDRATWASNPWVWRIEFRRLP